MIEICWTATRPHEQHAALVKLAKRCAGLVPAGAAQAVFRFCHVSVDAQNGPGAAAAAGFGSTILLNSVILSGQMPGVDLSGLQLDFGNGLIMPVTSGCPGMFPNQPLWGASRVGGSGGARYPAARLRFTRSGRQDELFLPAPKPARHFQLRG